MSNGIENFQRGNALFKFTFDETAKKLPFLLTIRNAFTEGFTCFEFNVNIKSAQWRARGALRPELHEEKDALNFAAEIWAEFEGIVAESIKP
jgi:hypothetical protein